MYQVVSELVRDAYEDGYDYFFQVNDDTVFKTKGASSGGHKGLEVPRWAVGESLNSSH